MDGHDMRGGNYTLGTVRNETKRRGKKGRGGAEAKTATQSKKQYLWSLTTE